MASQAPEPIDDGPHCAPSKRSEAVESPYGKRHGTMGPELAMLIGLAASRSKCPLFDAWITRLETLTPLAPAKSPDIPLHPAPDDV